MGLELRQEAIVGDTSLGLRLSEALCKNGYKNRMRSGRASTNSSLS